MESGAAPAPFLLGGAHHQILITFLWPASTLSAPWTGLGRVAVAAPYPTDRYTTESRRPAPLRADSPAPGRLGPREKYSACRLP